MSAAAPPQPAQPPSDTPAQAVGNQFVSQYYTVQHASPKHLHRFYSEASTLTYGEVRPEGFLSKQATGQKTIHELVMELGYEDTSTEIYTVDSQYSLGGGVVVQATGVMQRPGGPKRPFVQTFFLAVQEKGYYVLNDIFRYLPLVPATPDNGGAAASAPQPLPASAPPVPPPPAVSTPVVPPPAAATPAAVTAQQLALQQMSLQGGGEHANGGRAAVAAAPVPVQYAYVAPGAGPIPLLPQQPPMPVPLPAAMMPGAVGPLPVAVPPPRVPPPPAGGGAAPPPRAQQPPKPAPGAESLSYAERLRQGGRASAPGSPTKAAGSTAAPAAAALAPAEEAVEPAARQQAAQHAAAAEAVPFDEQPNASIFVRGIPASVSAAQLVERLGQFGRLRPQGVILKAQKGRDSFAFIDFEDPAPAQLLLSEGLEIEGTRLDVQPKRPLIFRPAPHGGRGDGGRGGANGGEGGRGGRYEGGRGGFRGGRGPRGPFPGPMQVPDGRPLPMGPMGGRGMGPPPGAMMPAPLPMGPMPGRGFPPEAYGGGGGGRGYGGGRGRGRGGPPPQQQPQQPPPAAAAPAPAAAPQPAAE